MPHLFTNRPRMHDLTASSADLRAQFRWETINAVAYKLGGLVFIIGSILFFPRFEAYADVGASTFFAGSLIYLLVTVHDLLEVRRNWRESAPPHTGQVLDYIAALSYVWGTILFTVGSVFFLSAVGWVTAGAWTFVVGSLLFVLGACVNVLQIVRAESRLTLQLMNLTALTFVVGSVLFAVASIPYLWPAAPQPFERTLFAFLAWQYLTGSALFFLGGLFNYWRAYVVVRSEIAARKSAAERECRRPTEAERSPGSAGKSLKKWSG